MYWLYRLIDKLLSSFLKDSLYKYTYLYGEIFISIQKNQEFVLFWISNKSNKLVINKYSWDGNPIGNILIVLIKKYEEIFTKLLIEISKELFNIWEESEFINIFDKEHLSFQNVKERLEFSFLDDYSYRRKGHYNFNFQSENKVLDIYHSDFECSKCNWPVQSFNNFPDYSETFNHKYFESERWKKSDYLFTNISDYESITVWWNEKVNEILQNKDLLAKYDLISLNKTCISVIMWDDIKSIFEYNKVDLRKTFYTDQNIDSPYRAVINYLKEINIVNNQFNKSNKNKIVFFWLNKNKNTYEIIKLLKDNFWVDVEKVLIPNIKIDDVKNILEYKLWVFFSWRAVMAQNIFKLYPFLQIETPVPYWISNNMSLLENILEKLWINNYKKSIDLLFNEYKNKNIDLYDSVKNYNVGFIIFDFHIKQFIDDNFRWTTIISMLKDMGFNIRFYIFSENDKYINDLNELKKMNYKILVSNNTNELEKFIIDKDIQLYYSEISSDSRIISKNKEQFSVWDMEYWIDWFYRTFRGLIKKCSKVKYLSSIISNIKK